eukprot:2341838-Pyramimonas_sp.AAC.1
MRQPTASSHRSRPCMLQTKMRVGGWDGCASSAVDNFKCDRVNCTTCKVQRGCTTSSAPRRLYLSHRLHNMYIYISSYMAQCIVHHVYGIVSIAPHRLCNMCCTT